MNRIYILCGFISSRLGSIGLSCFYSLQYELLNLQLDSSKLGGTCQPNLELLVYQADSITSFTE